MTSKMAAKIAAKREASKILLYPEMCDCCGKNYDNIYRATFFSKRGVKYVIRYCENCNPYVKWELLGLS